MDPSAPPKGGEADKVTPDIPGNSINLKNPINFDIKSPVVDVSTIKALQKPINPFPNNSFFTIEPKDNYKRSPSRTSNKPENVPRVGRSVEETKFNVKHFQAKLDTQCSNVIDRLHKLLEKKRPADRGDLVQHSSLRKNDESNNFLNNRTTNSRNPNNSKSPRRLNNKFEVQFLSNDRFDSTDNERGLDTMRSVVYGFDEKREREVDLVSEKTRRNYSTHHVDADDAHADNDEANEKHSEENPNFSIKQSHDAVAHMKKVRDELQQFKLKLQAKNALEKDKDLIQEQIDKIQQDRIDAEDRERELRNQTAKEKATRILDEYGKKADDLNFFEKDENGVFILKPRGENLQDTEFAQGCEAYYKNPQIDLGNKDIFPNHNANSPFPDVWARLEKDQASREKEERALNVYSESVGARKKQIETIVPKPEPTDIEKSVAQLDELLKGNENLTEDKIEDITSVSPLSISSPFKKTPPKPKSGNDYIREVAKLAGEEYVESDTNEDDEPFRWVLI